LLVPAPITGVGAATDSRQLLDSRVGLHSSLVVAYSRVRHTRVGRTLEYVVTATPTPIFLQKALRYTVVVSTSPFFSVCTTDSFMQLTCPLIRHATTMR